MDPQPEARVNDNLHQPTLKMEAAIIFETFISIYQIGRLLHPICHLSLPTIRQHIIRFDCITKKSSVLTSQRKKTISIIKISRLMLLME